ncbi:fatty acid desaturase [Cyanobium gracile UHCC 0139]|uniref:Fatty acid desaturase n=1 Tax=Cyanobium gracile UHCC 0139 TaxID=3110308 RepID=A0ABU5RXU5_9CYAN|nr:fatty acid desaturase [Cyanobium gracile]MEA5392610.1 fatty acid desaturase [Cyanobium gracile UHCC 0139]
MGTGILGAWLVTLVLALLADPAGWTPAAVGLAMALRTFLQTGLFILGHDAMHRTLVPGRPRLNDALGRLALMLYAGLPYGRCRRHHLRHHRFPGSRLDPDYRRVSGDGALRWYARFMGNYLSVPQLVLLLASWLAVGGVLMRLEPRLVLAIPTFWVLPLVLSSCQLFLFGTYLPHRGDGSTLAGCHAIRSLGYPHLLSLLACFHFGYHREHHAHPAVPWFRLPQLRRRISDRPGHGPGHGYSPANGSRPLSPGG